MPGAQVGTERYWGRSRGNGSGVPWETPRREGNANGGAIGFSPRGAAARAAQAGAGA